jgi:hypothetical protein
MKKLFVSMIVVASVVAISVSVSAQPKKGELLISANDSTATYLKSDSAKFADKIPAGFKAVQKPR